MKLEF